LDRSPVVAFRIPQHYGSSNQKESTGNAFALEFMRKAEASFERSEFAVSSDAVLQLAARSNCTAYDCEFVALAHAQGVHLITADREILREFPEVAISLDKFLRDQASRG
jgi:predicted nucleic acid-binding protein